jgi:signal transduction histidine kinase
VRLTAAAAPDDLRPAWCFVAAPVAAGLAGLALVHLGGSGLTATDVVRIAVVVAVGVAGVELGVRRRNDRLGPITLAVALIAAAAMLADAVFRNGGSAAAGLVARAGLGALPGASLHLLASLPDGRLRTRGRRALVVVGYVVGTVAGATASHTGGHVSLWPVTLVWIGACGAGLVVANVRYRAVGPVERRRMQWVGWAIAVWTEIALVLVALHLMAAHPGNLTPWLLGASVLFPASLVAGVHAGMVARVDRLLTHTVSLAGLTALVVVAYLAVVVALGRSLKDGERSLLLLSMAAAVLAGLAYVPARTRLADITNQLVYGERIAPEEALRTFGSRLTRTIPLDELLLQMVESLRKSMNLTSAQCWTGGHGRYDVAASVPHVDQAPLRLGERELSVVSRAGISGGSWLGIWLPTLVAAERRGSTRVAPIAHLGELLGLIVVGRADGHDFNDEDDRVLTELARQVGLALHNAQLDSALQASLDELQQVNLDLVDSRRRIVAAGDAERRKLERNLHDGAQQHLVAMAVKLRLAEDLVDEEPSEALGLIGELRANMQLAIADLRALAHGIFPPLLSSGGLAEALPSAAGRAALPTTVELGTIGRYDPELEASVYFCCMEAMQNAGKYAGDGATAVVRVGEADGVLSFDVADDGVGFDVGSGTTSLGHGFVNMNDRLGAIGGHLVVTSTPGRGTTVRGVIPLTSPGRE